MQQRLRRALPDILIIALLAIIPLVFLFPQVIGGRTMLPVDNIFAFEPYTSLASDVGITQPHNMLVSDLILENYQWKTFMRDQLLAKDIPLWQPNILSGSPFFAAGQASVLYPFNLLFLLLPVAKAYGWFTFSQLWLAGICMFVFARVLGLRRQSGLIAAVAYQMGGFFLASTLFTMILGTAVWLPLILASVELTLRQHPLKGQPSSLPWVLLGGLVLGVASLSGHVEALYLSLLVAGFYAGARLIAEVITSRGDRAALRSLAIRSLWLLALVALGLTFGAVQLLPAYELASSSARIGSNTLDEILSFAYLKREILRFFMPNFFGSPAHHRVFDVFTRQWVAQSVNAAGAPVSTTEWGIKNYVEGGAYLGQLTMLLATISLAGLLPRLKSATGPLADEAPGRPYRWIFFILAIVSLLIVFGSPLYGLLYHVLPFMDQSRAIFRWVWPLTLVTAVLAGFGMELLLSARDVGSVRKLGRIAAISAMIAGALVIIGTIGAVLAYEQIAGLVERAFSSLALAPGAFADSRAFFSYQVPNALLFGAMLALAGFTVHLLLRQKADTGIRAWLAPGAATVILAADLMLPFAGFLPANDVSLLDITPPSIEWLQGKMTTGEPFRVMVYEDPGADTLNANIAWMYGLEDAAGYDSLIPGQYLAYMEAIAPQVDLPYNRIAPIYAEYGESLNSPLFDMLNIRYVISEREIPYPKFTLAYSDEAVFIYENHGAVPRAFTLPESSALVYADDEKSDLAPFAQMILSQDIRQHVMLPFSEAKKLDLSAATGAPASLTPAAVTVYTAQEIFIDAHVTETSWLIDSGAMYPGWRAWIRPIGAPEDQEQEVPVALVNGNFRGVRLQPGDWTVRLKFSPDSFRFGAFTSFMSGLLVIFLAAVWLWRRAYRESPETSSAQRVAKNAITPVLLNLFNKGISFALTFVAFRVLGPGGSGKYGYAVAVWGIFEIFVNFGLNTYLTREVARDKDSANRYLVNTTLLRLFLAVAVIPLLAGFIIIRQMTIDPALDRDTLWTIGLLYGGLFFSTISTGLTALFYAYEKAEYPAVIQTVSGFLNSVIGVLMLLLGWGIIGLAISSIIVNAITLILLLALTARFFFKPRWEFDRTIQKQAMAESLPLMLNHLLATLFFRIAIILLEAMKGAVVVGWYRVVYTWVDMLGVIPSFFTQALFPLMSRQAHENRESLRRTYSLALKVMALVIVPIALVTTLLATPLIRILAGVQYLPHGAIALQVFIWAMVIGWMNSVTQYVIIALDRQRTLTRAFLVTTIFNVIANLLVIPRFSYTGAAAVAILSEIVLLIQFLAVIRQEMPGFRLFSTVGSIWVTGLAMIAMSLFLDPVSTPLAVIIPLLFYAIGILLINPLDQGEWGQVSAMLPARLRDRFGGLIGRLSAGD